MGKNPTNRLKTTEALSLLVTGIEKAHSHEKVVGKEFSFQYTNIQQAIKEGDA